MRILDAHNASGVTCAPVQAHKRLVESARHEGRWYFSSRLRVKFTPSLCVESECVSTARADTAVRERWCRFSSAAQRTQPERDRHCVFHGWEIHAQFLQCQMAEFLAYSAAGLPLALRVYPRSNENETNRR